MNNEIIGSNEFQQAVELLVDAGYTILQIDTGRGDYLFWLVYKWADGFFNTAQSIEYNTVEGINITDFMYKNVSVARNGSQFLGAFDTHITKSYIVRMEFNRDVKWYKYSGFGGQPMKRT